MAEGLPADAAAIIEALLPPGTRGREELLRQLPHCRVERRCGCGCATVDLAVDNAVAPPATVAEDGIVAEGSFSVDGAATEAGVLLLVANGYLSCLEVYSALDEPVTTWPAPHLLELGFPTDRVSAPSEGDRDSCPPGIAPTDD
ncbi:hypothetical protein [Streptomyces silvisoli]|uniref:Uncharacterized protein n=1 Tax=Streptomyces silvisoli TaxID=3034235 RepID=A0ABT5ZQ93_9ACTN|nr:hypothetical protein [Streptomyces silvisoli]MDF3291203.1 hypothetical protein [Streptomyces silvisoli]